MSAINTNYLAVATEAQPSALRETAKYYSHKALTIGGIALVVMAGSALTAVGGYAAIKGGPKEGRF